MASRASSSKAVTGRTIRIGSGQPDITIPRIFMPQDVFQRITAYVDLYPKEIAGIGRVAEIAPRRYLVSEAFLVRQDTNEAAHVDISEGVAEFAEARAREDLGTADYRFWWHSHVDFPATWSDEDLTTARTLFDERWLIAMVMNRRREFRIRFECFSPVPLAFDNLPLELILRDSIEVRAAAEADIRAHVTERPPTSNDLPRKRRGFGQLVRDLVLPDGDAPAVELETEAQTSDAPPTVANPADVKEETR